MINHRVAGKAYSADDFFARFWQFWASVAFEINEFKTYEALTSHPKNSS